MKAFLPNYPFSRRHSIRIFLQPSVLFVSGSVLLYGKGQGPSQTYPKASNFPVAEVPPLSSRAMSEPPAQDKPIFSTELLKVICPPSKPFANSLLACCLGDLWKVISTHNTMIWSCTLACHQDTIT